MNNKNIGIIIVIISIIALIGFSYIVIQLNKVIQQNIDLAVDSEGNCAHDPSKGICPYESKAKLSIPVYTTATFIAALLLFGIYLFTRKPQIKEEKPKEQIREFKESKEEKNNEKFNIILSALDESEQKVMKAVREQDGITQSTLRIRTDMSKTKLSLVLKDLEGKNLVKKVIKGKTNQIFLKRAF